MKQYIHSFCKRHKLGLLSFFIPLFTLLVIFAARRIYPFGDESFLHSDMYHQYMPFFSELMHKLKNGEDLYYSWNIGLGSNFLALFVYYLASPFNWLTALVPESLLMEFMSYLIIVKISACGLTFGIYLRRHFHTKSCMTVLFSTFYALSGFIAAYNWDIMWLDNVILAPLIILGLERLVLQKKYLLYCITLALSILSNYYISIMICIYLVLYFIVLVATHPDRLKAIFPFTGYSLLAGGLSGVLLIPELFALHFTEFSDFHFPQKISSYFSVIDMLARHFVNVTTEQGLNHWPNIYCGVAILLLLPLYVLNRRIRLSEKMAKLSLLFFLLISFSTNVLNFIWHGFNYPDSLPCRQSFLYILLLLTLCYEALAKIKEISRREIVLVFWGAFFFVMVCERIVDNQDAFRLSSYLATYLLTAGYAGLLLWYHRLRQRGYVSPDDPLKEASPAVSSIWSGRRTGLSAQNLLVLITTFVVVFESGMNMAVTSVSTTSRSKYLSGHDAYHTLVERTREKDPDFYRFEKFNRTTKNDGALIGYPTASLFSSTGNSYVGDFYEKLGMSYSKVFYCFDGATPLTSALLSVRYMFSDAPLASGQSLYEPVDSEGGIYLYRNNYSLPLGYMVSSDFALSDAGEGHQVVETSKKEDSTLLHTSSASEPERDTETDFFTELFLGDDLNEASDSILDDELSHDDYTPLETQNRMAAALSDGETLFLPVSTEVDGLTTILEAPEDGYYYGYVNNSAVRTVTFQNGDQKKDFKKLNHNHILDLGWLNAGTTVTLVSKENEDLTLSAYRMNENTLSSVINVLNRQTLTVDSFDSRSVTGHINVTEPGQLIITIPYEPGWTLKVDGTESEMGRFADTFICLNLEEGEHTIELSYYPAGLNLGYAISGVCLVILTGIWIWKRKQSKDQKKFISV